MPLQSPSICLAPSPTMEPQLYTVAGEDLLVKVDCQNRFQDEVAAKDISSNSWTSSCHRIARRSPSTATRHAPYPAADCENTADATFDSSACMRAAPQQQQSAAAGPFNPAACSQPLSQQQQQQQQQQFLVGSLRQQPLESLLELAITLASKSLSRTMEAFQVACNCWAFSCDSDAAAQALKVAEECMARTMHRMQIVQQLAAAVLSRKQSQALAAHQAGQQQRMLAMMQALQGQYLGTVPEDEEEEGEEVSSSWKPAGQL
ncbi:hypothetical protein OEZ85_003956 [Tetradesmus obliquus]|uniref:Uncharacterized protein n=1 Tax=Tetradesmus obliquus TaxID=3088 RepID=A0ABY8UE53_TETOB|nr:hypothetical protein OEZ85_003956 [Tetradesmus obliquus]